jgi:hypothetical protein
VKYRYNEVVAEASGEEAVTAVPSRSSDSLYNNNRDDESDFKSVENAGKNGDMKGAGNVVIGRNRATADIIADKQPNERATTPSIKGLTNTDSSTSRVPSRSGVRTLSPLKTSETAEDKGQQKEKEKQSSKSNMKLGSKLKSKSSSEEVCLMAVFGLKEDILGKTSYSPTSSQACAVYIDAIHFTFF